MNYHTKFSLGQRVQITDGLYKGLIGSVTDYMPNVRKGLYEDNRNRKLETCGGMYTIKVSFLKRVECEENSLVECYK